MRIELAIAPPEHSKESGRLIREDPTAELVVDTDLRFDTEGERETANAAPEELLESANGRSVS